MTGEEFLRGWAAEIVGTGDMGWYQRFYSIVEALEIVGEIDVDTAREIGQGIRAGLSDGLTARIGHAMSDFYLGSRRAQVQPVRGSARPRPDRAPQLSVRAALAVLPPSLGAGGTNFISAEGATAWLVCSGAGRAPWPEHDMAAARPPGLGPPGAAPVATMIRLGLGDAPAGPPSPPFLDVVDDHRRHYRLSHDSSGASASGAKRQRWDLRARIDPVPGADVAWLEFVTEQGPMRAPLRPPAQATTTTAALDPAPSELERYLNAEIHNQVWLHLLDPDRPLEPLGVIPEALIAVGAIDPGHPLVQGIFAVDAALAGAPPPAALPEALAASLRRDPASSPWLGVEALGVPLELGGVCMTLEALVGHRDRLAVHFLQAPSPFPTVEDGPSAHGLVVWATDDLGGGYAGHAEPLGGMDKGAYHLRPPLASGAKLLTLRLQGLAHRATVDIRLP